MRSSWHRCVMAFVATLVMVPGLVAWAQNAPSKHSPVIWYEVDPHWPQRPAGVEWGAVSGIAVDQEDHVWVFTRAQPPIQVYDTSGKYLRGFGQDIIRKAHHIKIDPNGNVWVTDVDEHVVLQLSPQGQVLLELGTRGVAGEDERHFNKPTDVAITPSGDVFVSDGYGNSRVVHFKADGTFVKAWGEQGTGPGQFDTPHAITVDSRSRIYVADRSNARVQVFDPSGKFLDQWQNVIVPWGFANGDNDQIWVCGSSAMPLREGDQMLGCPPKDQLFAQFASSGRLMQLWTVPKGADGHKQPGELNWVHAIALDSQGNIYAGDIVGQRAQKFVRRD